MSDEETSAPTRWWPQSVRVRLTIVATLAFAITHQRRRRSDSSGSCTTTWSTASRRRTSSSSTSCRTQVDRGELNPKPRQVCVYVAGVPQRVPSKRLPDRSDFEEAQRQVDTQAGRITLVAQQSTAAVNRTVDSVTDVLLFAVPAMIVLVALAAWYFTGRALKPVEAIRQEAESITGATIDRRVPEPDTDDEVGRLARTDERDARPARDVVAQKQRQFVSDASHELRSPLSSIRTNLEVALRNADRADWPAVAQRALAEDVRMEDTVSELLELARLDEAAGPQPLDIAPRDRPRRARARRHRAAAPGSRRHAHACPPGGSHGRRDQLTRVVRNLLDNAARHARTAVAVELRDRRRARSCSPSTTTAPASRSKTASGCSTGSPASTTAAPATPVASVSGCRW